MFGITLLWRSICIYIMSYNNVIQLYDMIMICMCNISMDRILEKSMISAFYPIPTIILSIEIALDYCTMYDVCMQFF